ncbi:hypothetical protein GH714_016731 [Hevea brasiliensis]|uniref:beta-galactosidase n=1 Tax=Hevea brasiliensis TaxID=3981 RepID=A0A6A6KT87_HEVBR|nr:hypothetical protein GH714_016731 [Hevea brasiliensis]
MKSFRVLSFSERDIIDAIKLENLIGKGGSGNVYKVVLGNGNEPAVKHIWTSNSSTDRKILRSSSAMLTKRDFRSIEFDIEVAIFSAVRHVNVVKLSYSITSEDSNLLVYEYLPNGSLWDQPHSYNEIKMGWELRFDLVRFVKTVQEASLIVHLRIGPYACAEWNYGFYLVRFVKTVQEASLLVHLRIGPYACAEWNYGFDLVRFVKTVQEASLLVHLRIGPYACAEWNYGFDLERFVKTVQEASLLVHLRIGPYACAEWNYGSIVIVIFALAL